MGVLSDLVRIVAARAARAGGGGEGSPADLEALRRAVGALDSYLDVLQFLRESRGSGSRRETSHSARDEIAVPRGWEQRTAGNDAPSGPVDRDAPHPTDGAQRSASSRGGPFPPFRDQETGLLSRAGFDAVVNGEMSRSARGSRPLTVLLFRLPLAAAELHGVAAPVIRGCLRASDVVGRDEDGAFLVALPETGEGEAAGVISRIAHRLAGVGAWDGETRTGLSSRPADGETLSSLMDRARRRLVAADRPSPG